MLKKLFFRRDRAPEFEACDGDTADINAFAKAHEPRGLSIARLTLGAFLVSALILAALALLVLRHVSNEVEELQQAAVRLQGERLAAEVAGRVQGLVAVIETAAAKPGLVDAMTQSDLVALASRADALASAIPGAVRVRFLPLGTIQPDDTQVPRLGYAALDLVREAEKGARPPFEVHWFGSADQHVAVARAIAAAPQTPAGVLLASIDLKLLAEWMKAAVPGGGYAELRQSAGDTYILLASQGDAALQGTPPTAAAKVVGTAWELVYWLPAQAGAAGRPMPLGLLALFAVAGVALAAVFAVLAAVATKLVRSDLNMLINDMVDLLSRKRDHSYRVRLLEFRQAVKMLDESVRPLAATEANAASPTTSGQSMPKTVITEDPLFLQHEAAIVVVEENAASEKEDAKG